MVRHHPVCLLSAEVWAGRQICSSFLSYGYLSSAFSISAFCVQAFGLVLRLTYWLSWFSGLGALTSRTFLDLLLTSADGGTVYPLQSDELIPHNRSLSVYLSIHLDVCVSLQNADRGYMSSLPLAPLILFLEK